MDININCYNIEPKEEKKWLDDFLGDVRFARDELENLYDAKASDQRAWPYDSDEAVHLGEQLEDLRYIIDAAEEYIDAIKKYKEDWLSRV